MPFSNPFIHTKIAQDARGRFSHLLGVRPIFYLQRLPALLCTRMYAQLGLALARDRGSGSHFPGSRATMSLLHLAPQGSKPCTVVVLASDFSLCARLCGACKDPIKSVARMQWLRRDPAICFVHRFVMISPLRIYSSNRMSCWFHSSTGPGRPAGRSVCIGTKARRRRTPGALRPGSRSLRSRGMS